MTPVRGLALAAALCARVSAAPAPAPGLGGRPVELKASDGWALKAEHSPAAPGRMSFVLLHGTGGRREDWKMLARALSRAGYGWLAPDLRGHGESAAAPDGRLLNWKTLRAGKAENGYADMTRDAEAAVAWLSASGTPEEAVGLIGAEVGGSVALKHAAVHPKAPLVVLLSPGLAWQDIPLVNAMRAYRDRPILLVHSEADKRSAKEAPILHQFARMSAGERRTGLLVVPKERGTRMLSAQRDLAGRILAWIAEPVRPEDLSGASTSTPSDLGPRPPGADLLAPSDESP